MRSIRLRNFRSLRDTGEVQLRPIVLLVGANSSGKSSLLRFFPLLKQTAWQTTSRSPLLWYVDNSDVDFRDFNNALLRSADEPTIEVFADLTDTSGLDVGVTTRIAGTADGRSHIESFTLTSPEHTVDITIGANGALESLTIDDRDITVPIGDKRLSTLRGGPIARIDDALALRLAEDLLIDLLAEHIAPLLDEDTFNDIVDTIIEIDIEESVEDALAELAHDNAYFDDDATRTAVAARFKNRKLIESIESILPLRHIARSLDRVDTALREYARGIRYIGPFRRSPQRFYRRSELRTDEIDRDGNNLAMFLDSLPESEREAFSSWLRQHFGFGVHLERQDAHVSVMVDGDSSRSFNIMDMGFGMSQLLPVVAQCWLASGQLRSNQLSLFRDPGRSVLPGQAPTLIAVEQPELHLHPHHQAQLADMFNSTAQAMTQLSQPICLCIETHSEAMLYRFGELVESGALRREDISILLFEKPPGSDESRVRTIEFDADGVLQDWPIGFFRG